KQKKQEFRKLIQALKLASKNLSAIYASLNTQAIDNLFKNVDGLPKELTDLIEELTAKAKALQTSAEQVEIVAKWDNRKTKIAETSPKKLKDLQERIKFSLFESVAVKSLEVHNYSQASTEYKEKLKLYEKNAKDNREKLEKLGDITLESLSSAAKAIKSMVDECITSKTKLDALKTKLFTFKMPGLPAGAFNAADFIKNKTQ
ncbi:MAG: hypothetical protein AAGG80_01235, partial [Pseudomonadota bacterium]